MKWIWKGPYDVAVFFGSMAIVLFVALFLLVIEGIGWVVFGDLVKKRRARSDAPYQS